MMGGAPDGLEQSYGEISAPAPSRKLWLVGLSVALLAHLIAAAPFLAPVGQEIDPGLGEEEGPGIGINLAPLIAPPEETAPPEPEPPVEPQVIEERAQDSPPPAAPAKPREMPDLPDIRPQSIPDLWLGGGGGTLTLEEFLFLESWLAAAREVLLNEMSYPFEARKFALSGSAEVIITSDRNGRVIGWNFRRRTGHAILDREIERSIRRMGRLPRFPEGTTHDQLSFMVPIHFQLMFQGQFVEESKAADVAAAAQSENAAPGLSVGELARCAQLAGAITSERSALEREREEIEALGADYEEQSLRYHRRNEDPPIRVRRMLDQYNARVEQFDQSVTAYDASVTSYTGICGQGSANWESYRQACSPYVATGNPYCEAFGDLWRRLLAGE